MTAVRRAWGLAMSCALALVGGACVERAAPADEGERRGLESAAAPMVVTVWREAAGDGRVRRGVAVRAERGSEGWFARARSGLVLEVGGERVALTGSADGVGARWIGDAGVLRWAASDGSAGLTVELSELEAAVERAPRFVRVPATGLIEAAVPVGVRP